jgi:hypothetical protein
MDVVVWLRSLGPGKYEALFRENDIDETVLGTAASSSMPSLLFATTRAVRRPPFTQRPHQLSQAHFQKTAPNTAKLLQCSRTLWVQRP